MMTGVILGHLVSEATVLCSSVLWIWTHSCRMIEAEGPLHNGSSSILSLKFVTQTHLTTIFLKMDQTRPLFVYFCSFHMTNTAQIL